MVGKDEIMGYARELDLPANTIEKDYVLSWVLAGIAATKEFRSNWVFKGGTCLKKCFFEKYRFSEDLDFTLLDEKELEPGFLGAAFERILAWVYNQTGIEMPADSLHFELYDNPRGNPSIEGGLSYRGPMKPGGDLPRIKLDLTADEKIVCSPKERKIYHAYSDYPSAGMHVLTYSLEEIFAEKIRALFERRRPRDLYDVIHLHCDRRWSPDRNVLLNALREKCAFKKMAMPTMHLITENQETEELREGWEHMLAHQIVPLGSFDSYWAQLPQVFEWLYE